MEKMRINCKIIKLS